MKVYADSNNVIMQDHKIRKCFSCKKLQRSLSIKPGVIGKPHLIGKEECGLMVKLRHILDSNHTSLVAK